MYHYVRDLVRTRFPAIRGRTIDEFRFQIDYLQKIGTFITARQLIDAVNNGTELPRDAVMVSFDDGYLDHYTNVLPILNDFQIEGLFFPPALPIVAGRVMDVNKIHFILASVPDTKSLVEQIKFWVGEHRDVYGLPPPEDLSQEYAKATRFDTAEAIFVRSVLQRRLPKVARNALVDYLFCKYVTKDESAFASELYMSTDQIRLMHQSGQYFGSHCYSHEWLDLLSPAEQVAEIVNSLNFLNGVGVPMTDWIMCYPYGGYLNGTVDAQLCQTLVEHGCSLAFTSHGGKADLNLDNRFLIRRMDTNDIPIN
jgi:peptidoglycan/xylan/chitin deacetylase (PgdA/CDA1 family)